MRRLPVFFAILGVALACSKHAEKISFSPKGTHGFLDRVWTVVESPGGSGDLYAFLSDGTFIRAAKEASPDVGKWSWDGKQLSLLWAANPYTADIDSLTDSYLRLTFHFMNKSFDVGLVPATASMPDTTRAVEFDPAQASIIAHGTKPTWLLHIDGDHSTLRMMGRTESYVDGEWTQQEPAYWDYSSRRTFPAGEGTLEFHLSSAMCVRQHEWR